MTDFIIEEELKRSRILKGCQQYHDYLDRRGRCEAKKRLEPVEKVKTIAKDLFKIHFSK